MTAILNEKNNFKLFVKVVYLSSSDYLYCWRYGQTCLRSDTVRVIQPNLDSGGMSQKGESNTFPTYDRTSTPTDARADAVNGGTNLTIQERVDLAGGTDNLCMPPFRLDPERPFGMHSFNDDTLHTFWNADPFNTTQNHRPPLCLCNLDFFND